MKKDSCLFTFLSWTWATCCYPELPSGVFNASKCHFGAPIFISQPHFYEADPYYARLLQPGSVHPTETLHETAFVFEPTTGIPLRLAARLQLNLKIDRIKDIDAFQNLPSTVFVPVMWSEVEFELSEHTLTEIWWLVNLKVIMISTGVIAIGIGVILALVGSNRKQKNYVNMLTSTQYGTISQE